MVVGLVRPDEGEVQFEEKRITDLPMHLRARLGIGYLTQEPSVFRNLTVEQNILAILETCKMGRQERQVRLKCCWTNRPGPPVRQQGAHFERGREAAIRDHRALVTSPKLLLLDEPFSGIDPIAVYEVQKSSGASRIAALGF
jgi:lipopolysaccharide export system ATP-binding protein